MKSELISSFVFHSCLGMVLFSCNLNDVTVFQEIKSAKSGIDFKNELTETADWGYVNYYYFYNGGGVAVGDVNNDGLHDIYFTGNMVPNKLYLNRGGLVFEDVSDVSGVSGDDRWMTGVTMADINNDGWLDIYVCASGLKDDTRNLLFINSGKTDENGIPVFSEQASTYGLDDNGYATQATFFDYDNDGDLDCYVMNHHVQFDWRGYESLLTDEIARMKAMDKLYKNLLNENGGEKFVDISSWAGIDSYGYGLGVIAQDFDNDGFVDIYVSNDFVSPDYFYVNNTDGTFTNQLRQSFGHTATQSMGLDAGDINNDGRTDLYVLDMLPEDNYRRKMTAMDRSAELFAKNLNDGNYYQYMTNVLQLNNGPDPISHMVSFIDIGEYAGITMTDWSWGPVMADFDNDGFKDIFVTTGIFRDVNYNDFWKHIRKVNGEWQVTQKEIEMLPSTPLSNYLFKNNGNFTFSNVSKGFGLDKKGFSNGSAYADLDNDGDLELIVNNVESEALLYENKTMDELKTHYISFAFHGREDNRFGFGVKLRIETESGVQLQELTLTRGYQSSVAPELHFGLDKDTVIEKATIRWPNGTIQTLYNIPADQKVMIDQKDAEPLISIGITQNPIFEVNVESGLDFLHVENTFDDFKGQYLLPYKLSGLGPALTTADIDNDGLDDLFIGGAKGFDSKLYVQSQDRRFIEISGIFTNDKKHEDVEALFFHANQDGLIDLYVCSGGYEKGTENDFFQDRLYINNGASGFSRVPLPEMNTSTATVVAGDIDNDGDMDLFVGGRLVPNNYPYIPRSYILQNDGNGNFTDITNTLNKDLGNPGMVTGALWSDVNSDEKQDLIVVGEWMPVRVFINTCKDFEEIDGSESGLAHSSGLWNCIESADLDDDGDEDYILGNIGLNYKYKASIEAPYHVFAGDIDRNGSLDVIMGFSQNGKVWPVRDKRSLTCKIPSLGQKYPDYESFARATVHDIFDNYSGTYYHKEVFLMASCVMENVESTSFNFHPLPPKAQLSSVRDIVVLDVNQDGHKDMVIAGNLFDTEPNTTRLDTGKGLLLLGDGHFGFKSLSAGSTGLWANRDVRKLALTSSMEDKKLLVVANNNDSLQLYNIEPGRVNLKSIKKNPNNEDH